MFDVTADPVEIGGYQKVKVTIRNGQNTIDTDTINPLNATQRRRAAERLAQLSGDPELTPARIEQKIMACLDRMQAEAAQKQQKEKEQQQAQRLPEVMLGDVRIVRPELFVTPEVTGLSVVEPVLRGAELFGRWRVYLAWGNGKRTAMDLPERIELRNQPSAEGEEPAEAADDKQPATLPGGDSLWLSPQPSEPKPEKFPHWSAASRRDWLAGERSADPKRLFVQLCDAFDHFLDMPATHDGAEGLPPVQIPVYSADGTVSCTRNAPWSTAVVSLWAMLSYCYPAWDAVPYLYIGGPSGSGKTRLFEIFQRLCFRGFSSSNVTAAAMFRTLHDRGGTLLLDEAERLNDGAPEVAELLSILLAGYKRSGTATRLESVSEGFVMQEFQVYGPKAIACINGLSGPLMARCIPIHMFRATPESPKPKRRLDARPQLWTELRDGLHTLALGQLGACACTLANLSDVCPFGGRHHELWQPLLALAEFVDADGAMGLGKAVATHAKAIILANQEQHIPECDLVILRTLTKHVLRGTMPTCKQILAGAEQEDKDEMRGITARRVSHILSRYGISAVKTNGKNIFRDVTLSQLRKVETCYGIDLGSNVEPGPSWRAY